MKNFKTGTYPPEAIAAKNDEVLSVCKVKRMKIWSSNNAHLPFMKFPRNNSSYYSNGFKVNYQEE